MGSCWLMTIQVNIQFSAKEGRAKEAAENMANRALPMTRKQPGCLSLEFSGDIEKNEFCVWGRWASLQDYDNYMAIRKASRKSGADDPIDRDTWNVRISSAIPIAD